MQKELADEGLPVMLQILGVNEAGHESGNDAISNGRDLPWLQEGGGHSVWTQWQVTYRDVILLDAENKPTTIYNLTEHSLANASDYDTLKSLLRQAAQAAASR
ncbi:MAG: hypothetical protein JSW67_08755 [Candidatus Latescibacterota bacterium]|nr:MAG: hypothetical protein JSW67_08755 [Candidatus Latescibacterota bacterium]